MNSAKKVALVLAAAGMAIGASVGTAAATDDGGARGVATGSPGVLSGDVIQIPIDIPINLCGNTIDIIGLLNPTFGNTCINGEVVREEHHSYREHHESRHEAHHESHHGGGHHQED
ncbi:chaplin [Streptomyces orinoci]|uniref:Chaplin n=1 Tax=Streptomyces orinoci TaxID=67339 RepID=A0ABV3JWR5_STRON|nr:chaplin [Streptomyces orinoci]